MYFFLFFFFKQKTAYEMRISDWSSDVCSSDLAGGGCRRTATIIDVQAIGADTDSHNFRTQFPERRRGDLIGRAIRAIDHDLQAIETKVRRKAGFHRMDIAPSRVLNATGPRSEEHTSELQSLMRTSSAVFCLKKKNQT